jgi:hypothetical protein
MHSHSATDINKGILGIARGGTGATSASGARRSLGIQVGSGSITGIQGQSVTKTVTFASAYSSIPVVVVSSKTPMHSTDVYLAVQSVTATGFTVQLYSDTLNPVIAFNWIACQ